jgi:hypothetical protein
MLQNYFFIVIRRVITQLSSLAVFQLAGLIGIACFLLAEIPVYGRENADCKI